MFQEACKALDSDGDGQIDPEEFKAVTSAKSDVDGILNAESWRPASDALDHMALTLLGYERVASYKLNQVLLVAPECTECITEHGLDQESLSLMAMVCLPSVHQQVMPAQ